jgi:hypothetical protein
VTAPLTKANIITAIVLGILAALAAIFMAGCTTIEYGTFKYQSIGGRKFEKLEVLKDGNGDILVEITNYQNEDTVRSIAAGIAEGLK